MSANVRVMTSMDPWPYLHRRLGTQRMPKVVVARNQINTHREPTTYHHRCVCAPETPENGVRTGEWTGTKAEP